MSDIHVTDATFQAEVLSSDVPVLVDFWAPWCGPCRMVAPVLAELGRDYEGRVKIVKVNSDENPEVVQQYRVQSIPLLNFYAGGELVRSVVGARPKQIIAQEIEAVLAEVGAGGAAAEGGTTSEGAVASGGAVASDGAAPAAAGSPQA